MKRRHHEEHINHERWAIPYGDLITLLLALFVVMYAVSAVNETKFRVMAQSINEAFNGTGKVIEPIREATPAAQVPLPNQSRAPAAAPIAKIDVPIPPRNLPLPGHEGAAPERQEAAASVNTATAANTAIGKTEAASLSQIADEVQRAMKPLIDKNMVSVRKTPDWLEIEVRTDILFPVGVAKLQAPAEDVLRKLAGILSPFPNAMRVEGYTDNTPIATATFPSNWELSAARAATVARLLTTTGVDPHRVGIIGWGEFRPTADNATDEGRNRNRRVLIVVMSDKAAPARFYSDADRVDLSAAGAR
ncbi:chemotaxis protein MotB [Luteibacter jiangsuensis]|uniref:Chemotaxis protein MotB n=1 Tax=Luteibacter jiangsuensis TaxID=637577 RepID=A0ABT9T1Z4_9GAMM|nr:flagellar motor protein MotD [Luteibacter jiangsuensis]MDQ0011300.1 chemotaxis protein MotB [Luteibacter jiangsuensis]